MIQQKINSKKKTALAEKVYTCYEAGPFGYTLHRRLEQMGVANYVIRPRDWDEYSKKVKTDKCDAPVMPSRGQAGVSS